MYFLDHATQEDEILFPALREWFPRAAEEASSEHAAHAKIIGQIKGALCCVVLCVLCCCGEACVSVLCANLSVAVLLANLSSGGQAPAVATPSSEEAVEMKAIDEKGKSHKDKKKKHKEREAAAAAEAPTSVRIEPTPKVNVAEASRQLKELAPHYADDICAHMDSTLASAALPVLRRTSIPTHEYCRCANVCVCVCVQVAIYARPSRVFSSCK